MPNNSSLVVCVGGNGSPSRVSTSANGFPVSDVTDFLRMLRDCWEDERNKLSQLAELRSGSHRDPTYDDLFNERIARIEKQIRDCHSDMERITERFTEGFLRCPPWHIRHRLKLGPFNAQGSYDRSVFVMTKFPTGSLAADQQLRDVVNCVANGLADRGFDPRIADKAQYHNWLWDEVELFLLGCSRGVAIVEDKCLPELNSNVAMEWGWMRAMGKPVWFLKEQSFTHGRADILGHMERTFDWNTPATGIDAALTDWIGPLPQGISPASKIWI